MKKILSSLFVILMTVLSVFSMVILKDRDYTISESYDGYTEDIYEYTGYIFDDYNKNVNLGYGDEVLGSKDKDGSQYAVTFTTQGEK